MGRELHAVPRGGLDGARSLGCPGSPESLRWPHICLFRTDLPRTGSRNADGRRICSHDTCASARITSCLPLGPTGSIHVYDEFYPRACVDQCSSCRRVCSSSAKDSACRVVLLLSKCLPDACYSSSAKGGSAPTSLRNWRSSSRVGIHRLASRGACSATTIPLRYTACNICCIATQNQAVTQARLCNTVHRVAIQQGQRAACCNIVAAGTQRPVATTPDALQQAKQSSPIAMACTVLQRTALCCTALQRIAPPCCTFMQQGANAGSDTGVLVACRFRPPVPPPLRLRRPRRVAPSYGVLQRSALRCMLCRAGTQRGAAEHRAPCCIAVKPHCNTITPRCGAAPCCSMRARSRRTATRTRCTCSRRRRCASSKSPSADRPRRAAQRAVATQCTSSAHRSAAALLYLQP